MKVVVNDANILIDLVELQLLSPFFRLNMEFHTTSLILDELFQNQQAALDPYISNGQLIIHEESVEDLTAIVELQQRKPTLSEQDCSAFYQASNLNATLLTSDNSLRKLASQKMLMVHGHLWIFDQMVENKTISKTVASDKLHELIDEVNPHLGLPKKECQERFKRWKGMVCLKTKVVNPIFHYYTCQ
ncbi:MAG TPA: hypothetical protein VJ991_12610 [Balneolales bacterium]|nr:hypothetical protein [Balneolales bacterium]HYX06611.1 hypothetical protein [Bacteroidales bacterium]